MTSLRIALTALALSASLLLHGATSPAVAKGEKCSVVVVDDMAPGQTTIVVGCAGSGLTVLNGELEQVYRWQACSACGGFFGSFAGVKTIKGRKALMVKMQNGARMEDGSRDAPTIALHYDGKAYQFADHFED